MPADVSRSARRVRAASGKAGREPWARSARMADGGCAVERLAFARQFVKKCEVRARALRNAPAKPWLQQRSRVPSSARHSPSSPARIRRQRRTTPETAVRLVPAAARRALKAAAPECRSPMWAAARARRRPARRREGAPKQAAPATEAHQRLAHRPAAGAVALQPVTEASPGRRRARRWAEQPVGA